MSCPTLAPLQARLSVPETAATTVDRSPIILSFDVEEHWRIEAAAHLTIDPAMKAHCRDRLTPSTQWLLDRLAERELKATFFVIGQIAEHSPKLVRAIQQAGHEVASHGWDHQRLHRLTPAMFRKDVRQSKNALEHVTGTPVLGYRAPTFSLMKETAWAIDVLAEEGFRYDSSIYPIRHDRYGVPGAVDVAVARHECARWRRRLFPPLAAILSRKRPEANAGELPAARVNALLPSLGVRPRSSTAAARTAEPIPHLRGHAPNSAAS